jgi:hypothetical protein
MKRAFALAAVLCLSASMASADYFGPPGWENNPFFTHQSWNFPTSLPLGVPYGPDAGYVNPNGMPLATRVAGSWLNDLGAGRQGGWSFGGGTSSVLASIYVPNAANQALKKELWFQATVKTNTPQDLRLAIAVYDNNGNPFTLATSLDVDPFAVDGDGTWAHVTGRYWIRPQPAWETVVLTGSLGPNEYLIVDQVDIDTQCVPEPSALAMLLGVGVLGWFSWRRRT